VAHTAANGKQRAPSETLIIFCHKSLEFQALSIGAVQEDGFCCYAAHQESQLLHNGNNMHMVHVPRV